MWWLETTRETPAGTVIMTVKVGDWDWELQDYAYCWVVGPPHRGGLRHGHEPTVAAAKAAAEAEFLKFFEDGC